MKERIQDAFNQIHAEEQLKEQTRQFLENTSVKRFSYQKLAAAMAVFVLVFGISSRLYLTPVSAISLEINPCIELGINRFDRVVSVDSYNDDGAALALDLSVKNKNYADAVDLILANATIAELLASNELMEVTVVSDDSTKSDRLLTTVRDCTSHQTNISCHAGNSTEAAEAHSHGLPLGKYRAYLELHALNPEITSEDVQDMTMRQIRDLIQALGGSYELPTLEETEHHEEDTQHLENETEHHEENRHHNGGGHGNGNGHGHN